MHGIFVTKQMKPLVLGNNLEKQYKNKYLGCKFDRVKNVFINFSPKFHNSTRECVCEKIKKEGSNLKLYILLLASKKGTKQVLKKRVQFVSYP